MLNRIYSPASLHEQITELGHQFVLIFHENVAAGFASYGTKTGATPTVYRLHKIYLDPALQGKGLGFTLMNFVLNEAKSAGATDLELNVNRQNATQAFLQKIRFHDSSGRRYRHR